MAPTVLGFFASLRTQFMHDKSKVHTVMVKMPALNTPQFGWVKSRLPRKAQPVPPIFQPEVAARAIYYAAHHPEKREYYAGWSTVKAIVGNKLLPSFGDRYLARNGYEAQQHDGAEDPNRPNNLWEPVSGDHGTYGSFDDRARSRSLELWAETHAKWLAIAAGLGLAGAALKLLSNIGREEDRQKWAGTKAAGCPNCSRISIMCLRGLVPCNRNETKRSPRAPASAGQFLLPREG